MIKTVNFQPCKGVYAVSGAKTSVSPAQASNCTAVKPCSEEKLTIPYHIPILFKGDSAPKESIEIDATVPLLPGFVEKPKLDPRNIEPKALVLVRMTEFAPKAGMVLSPRDAMEQNGVCAARSSSHWTLNHSVQAHAKGDWTEYPYAILMPFDKTVEKNPGVFAEGLPNDIYTNGSLKIPQDSVIVKFNANVPDGKYRISDYGDIKGCKLVETSDSVHSAATCLVEQMGYAKMIPSTDDGLFKKDDMTSDEALEAWYKFATPLGIQPMIHSSSPNGKMEQVIEALDQLSADNKWAFYDGEWDFKKILLDVIADAKKRKKEGYRVNIDLDVLEEIIKKSKHPRNALIAVEKELKLKPCISRERNTLFHKKVYRNCYASNLSLHFCHPDVRKKYLETYKPIEREE